MLKPADQTLVFLIKLLSVPLKRLATRLYFRHKFCKFSFSSSHPPFFVCLSDHRTRRKSIATGKQPSMDVSPTAPLQPFRQSVSNPLFSRPHSLSTNLPLSLLPVPALNPPPHPCGHQAGGSLLPPSPPSLVSPSAVTSQQRQQQLKGSIKWLGTPSKPSSLPLSSPLSFTLPSSPAASSSSPRFLYWGGDWIAAGSSPAARGPFIAPLPPFEVCHAVIIEAEWIPSNV